MARISACVMQRPRRIAAIAILAEHTTLRRRKPYIRGVDPPPSPLVRDLFARAGKLHAELAVRSAHLNLIWAWAHLEQERNREAPDPDECVLGAVNVFRAAANLVRARRELGIKPEPNTLSTLLRSRGNEFLAQVDPAALVSCGACGAIMLELAEFEYSRVGFVGERLLGGITANLPSALADAIVFLEHLGGERRAALDTASEAAPIFRRCADASTQTSEGGPSLTGDPAPQWLALAAIMERSPGPHVDGLCARTPAKDYVGRLLANAVAWAQGARRAAASQ